MRQTNDKSFTNALTTVVNQGFFHLFSRHKQQQQQQQQHHQRRQQKEKTNKKLETIKTASYFAPFSCKPSRTRSFVTSFICEGLGLLGTSGAKSAISWYTINTSLPDTHSTGHWALERNKCNEHYSKTGKGTTQSFIWLLKWRCGVSLASTKQNSSLIPW